MYNRLRSLRSLLRNQRSLPRMLLLRKVNLSRVSDSNILRTHLLATSDHDVTQHERRRMPQSPRLHQQAVLAVAVDLPIHHQWM